MDGFGVPSVENTLVTHENLVFWTQISFHGPSVTYALRWRREINHHRPTVKSVRVSVQK